jgi:hypothetical protein
MDNFVKETILPISQEEKKSLAKTAIFTSIFVVVFESLASYMLIKLFPEDFGIIRWFALGFFYLVGGLIMFIGISSYFAKTKKVLEGFITDKRIYTSYSSGGRWISNSSSITYYITLGDREMSVMNNIYVQASVGDKVAIHMVKMNSNIFKIEVLESYIKLAESNIEHKSFREQKLSSIGKTSFFTPEDRSIVRKKLFELLFKRSILMGAVCGLLFLVIFLFVILGLKVVFDQMPIYFGFYIPFGIAIVVYFWVNKKTYYVLLDLSSGEKRVVDKQVKDRISNNKPMFSTNGTYTSGAHGEYHYLITVDGSFYSVTSGFAKSLEAGDLISVHETKKSKILLSIQEKIV